MTVKLPKEFLEKLKAATGKRPKTVIDHILKHGFITTEELKDIYGYSHPPRAKKDVTDLGIPIEAFKAKGKDGRTIAAYRFGDPSLMRGEGHVGRVIFPKKFKKLLIEKYGCNCAICGGEFQPLFLQIDHRIPYEVAGHTQGELDPDDYMLVCRSCNRAKSWSCEHCPNGSITKNPKVCGSCYWAHPESYEHIATQQLRRLDIVWKGREVEEHDRLSVLAEALKAELPEFVKAILRRHLTE